MSSISLRDVVAFLRHRDALGVLEGAPYVEPTGACPLDLRALQAVEDATADALLYLGTSEICPAAAGWAARVLALAIADETTHIDFSALNVAELMRRDRLLARWIWHDYPPRFPTFRERPIIGAPPETPAERLAAVLRYELERAK